MTKKESDIELCKFARLYLGSSNWSWLQKTSKEELKLFKSFPINLATSYIVYGTPEMLSKFKAFYLTRCLKSRPLYMQCFIGDYANALMSSTKDEYGLNIDQDLIFLYIHEHSISEIGKSEMWLSGTILNKVASRNREGLVTIILSEIRVASLEAPREFKIIRLNKVMATASLQEAMTSIKNNGNDEGAVFN